MTKSDHIHKYQRVKWGKNKTIVWRCMLPNCQHYLHSDFIVGKVSICHGCGSQYVITLEKSHRAKPKCDDCLNPNLKQIDDLLKDLL